jgi:hypothetical protein
LRLLWKAIVSRAPVTRQPIGYRWAKLKDGGNKISINFIYYPSRISGYIHWIFPSETNYVSNGIRARHKMILDYSKRFRIYKESISFIGRDFDKYNRDIPEHILAMKKDKRDVIEYNRLLCVYDHDVNFLTAYDIFLINEENNAAVQDNNVVTVFDNVAIQENNAAIQDNNVVTVFDNVMIQENNVAIQDNNVVTVFDNVAIQENNVKNWPGTNWVTHFFIMISACSFSRFNVR